MDLSKVKDIVLNTEKFALIIVDLYQNQGNFVEHEVHNFERIFSKSIEHLKEDGIKKELSNFSHDVIHKLGNDIKGLKKLYCFHPKHSDILVKMAEKSLIEKGFEDLVKAGIVVAVSEEIIPLLLTEVTAKIITKEVFDKIKDIRNSFNHTKSLPPPKP